MPGSEKRQNRNRVTQQPKIFLSCVTDIPLRRGHNDRDSKTDEEKK